MRVVVDDKIPYIREALSAMGVDAVYAPGSHINNALVRDADALIIRTRTRCDAALLQGSRVQFIATTILILPTALRRAYDGPMLQDAMPPR